MLTKRSSRWGGSENQVTSEISRSPYDSVALKKWSKNNGALESDQQQVRFIRYEHHDLGQII